MKTTLRGAKVKRCMSSKLFYVFFHFLKGKFHFFGCKLVVLSCCRWKTTTLRKQRHHISNKSTGGGSGSSNRVCDNGMQNAEIKWMRQRNSLSCVPLRCKLSSVMSEFFLLFVYCWVLVNRSLHRRKCVLVRANESDFAHTNFLFVDHQAWAEPNDHFPQQFKVYCHLITSQTSLMTHSHIYGFLISISPKWS